MSLGTKIKDALRGPDYSERSQNDIDQRPPGAFPADDVPSSQYTGATDIGHSGSQRNKLHKPDDPRGWGGSEGNNPGHRYTDSGVGLMEHNDPAKLPAQDPTAESGRQMPEPLASRPHEDKAAGTRAFGLGSSSANDYDQTGSAAAGPGNGAAKTEGISSEPSALAGSGVEGQQGDDSTRQSGSHPYWGDIPRGVGVYNTVTGHGSAEDEQHHHNGQHAVGEKGTTTEPAAPGAETSDLTKPEAADLAPVSRDQPGAIHDSTKSSGHGDALPAAGVGAGAAGIAAYEASKRHDHDTTKDQKPFEGDKTAAESTEHDEKKGNKLTALFHSGHKDDKSESKPKEEVITEHRHEKQHEKHEKDKHPKEEKDSKLAGILHRDNKDEKQSHHQKPEDEAKPRRSEDKYEENLDEAKAAALAAYAAHEVDDKHHEKAAKHDKDRSAEPDSPKEKKESKLHALFHRSHKDKDSKNAHEEEKKEEKKAKHHEDRKEPVVVPITQERITRQDQDRPYQHHRPDAEAAQTQPTQERDSSHWKEGAAAAGAGGAAGYMATKAAEDHREHGATAHPTQPSQPAQPTSDFSKPYAAQPYAAQPQQDLSTLGGSTGTAPSAFPETRQPPTTTETSAPQQEQHHYGQTAALAGAGAAGVGAAAYYGQKHHQHDTTQAESTGPTPPPKDTPAPYQQPQQSHSGAAAATTGAAAAAPFASSHETPVTKADEPNATTATAPAIPSNTQGATETKYNVLPSGTVSGVKVVNSSAPQEHQASPRAANDTFLSNDARPTDKAAAPVPVPAPSSATEQRSTKEETAPAPAAAAAAPVPTQAPDSSNKVIHKCHNCGEDNDISHYFNK